MLPLLAAFFFPFVLQVIYRIVIRVQGKGVVNL